MKNLLRSERGATLVYVALSSFVLLMFLGLSTDTGWLVWVRTQGQKRVDAAALAAAAALVDQNAGNRSSKAATLANTFSDSNLVVDSSTDPANVVSPMSYNLTTGVLTDLGSDWTPGATGANCNAVKVTTAVPTPVFFSGVRNFVTGAAEASTTNINVSAIAHLPCPGSLNPQGAALAPIALRQCKFTTADDCENTQTLFQSPDSGTDNSAFTTFNLTGANDCKDIADGPPYPSGLDAEVEIGETINLVGSGAVTSCLKDLQDRYSPYCTTANRCGDPPDPACTVAVPIVDQCTGGGGTAASSGKVVGFATICFTGFDSKGSPKFIQGSLECNEYPPGTGGAGGACLGSYARGAILVQ